MNVPRGFQLNHGHVTHVDPLAAMFNPAWATETSHMVIGAYLATAFGVASVYAVGMLRGRRDSYHRRALAVALATAAVIAPLQLGVGDLLGRTVAHNQPAKLAAIEGQFPSERGAGLSLGSFPIPGTTARAQRQGAQAAQHRGVRRPNAKVRGLASFPKTTARRWRSRCGCRSSGMVGIGTFLVALASGTGSGAGDARGPRTAGRCSPSPAPGRSRSSPTSSVGWCQSSAASPGSSTGC